MVRSSRIEFVFRIASVLCLTPAGVCTTAHADLMDEVNGVPVDQSQNGNELIDVPEIASVKPVYFQMCFALHPTNYGAYQSMVDSSAFRLDFAYDILGVYFPVTQSGTLLLGLDPTFFMSFGYDGSFSVSSQSLNVVHLGTWLSAQYYYNGRAGFGNYLDLAIGPSYAYGFQDLGNNTIQTVFGSWGLGGHLGWGSSNPIQTSLGLSGGFFVRVSAISVTNTSFISGIGGIQLQW